MPIAEDLGEFALFDRLSADQRAAVAQTAEPVAVDTGTTLFRDGDEAVGCWLIRTGHVALTTAVPGRPPVVVHTLGCGDVLGWSWLVPPHHWHFTATTIGPMTGFRLDTAWLRALAQQDPSLGYPLALGLIEGLLARLQSTRARLLDVYGSPRDR